MIIAGVVTTFLPSTPLPFISPSMPQHNPRYLNSCTSSNLCQFCLIGWHDMSVLRIMGKMVCCENCLMKPTQPLAHCSLKMVSYNPSANYIVLNVSHTFNSYWSYKLVIMYVCMYVFTRLASLLKKGDQDIHTFTYIAWHLCLWVEGTDPYPTTLQRSTPDHHHNNTSKKLEVHEN